jgi:hypothetical protein
VVVEVAPVPESELELLPESPYLVTPTTKAL